MPNENLNLSKIKFNGTEYELKDATAREELNSLANVASSGSYNDLSNKPNLSNYMVKGTDYVTAGQKSGTTLGLNATAEGQDTTANGISSHAEGYKTTASQNYSHAEGWSSTASGYSSHAEGSSTEASGDDSHSEGSDTTASGDYSHAEGGAATASGESSHAEGDSTTASGDNSHAEGSDTIASGETSHAEGLYTIAQRNFQHVFGKYNIADTTGSSNSIGQYVEIVGNGTALNNRSNARTLDWSGNEVLAGKLTVGAGPTANMDVATKQYVDNAISGSGGIPTATTDDFDKVLTVNRVPEETWATFVNGTNITPGTTLITQQNMSNGFTNKEIRIQATLAEGTYLYQDGVIDEVVLSEDNEVAILHLDQDLRLKCYISGKVDIEDQGSSIGNDNTFTTITISTRNILPVPGWGDTLPMLQGVHYVTAGQLEGSTLGEFATVEGYGNTASGWVSHAEGYSTTAFGYASHAEGAQTMANGVNSHAEGNQTIASGENSHAEGNNTIAQREEQHVFGSYNIADTTGDSVNSRGSYIEIVGNGTINSRSNARTLDWNGNEILAGKLTVGTNPTNNMDVATKQYVDSKSGLPTWTQGEDEHKYLTINNQNEPFIHVDTVIVGEYAATNNEDIFITDALLQVSGEINPSYNSVSTFSTTGAIIGAEDQVYGYPIEISIGTNLYLVCDAKGYVDILYNGTSIGSSYEISNLEINIQTQGGVTWRNLPAWKVIDVDNVYNISQIQPNTFYRDSDYVTYIYNSVTNDWQSIGKVSLDLTSPIRSYVIEKKGRTYSFEDEQAPISLNFLGEATTILRYSGDWYYYHDTTTDSSNKYYNFYTLLDSDGSYKKFTTYSAKNSLAATIMIGTNPITTYSTAPTITNTLSSGNLIATINGTNIYAPAYTDADGVSY